MNNILYFGSNMLKRRRCLLSVWELQRERSNVSICICSLCYSSQKHAPSGPLKGLASTQVHKHSNHRRPDKRLISLRRKAREMFSAAHTAICRKCDSFPRVCPERLHSFVGVEVQRVRRQSDITFSVELLILLTRPSLPTALLLYEVFKH